MERALWSSVSGMKAQELSLDNIANNLANINTNGFKPSRINFQDMLYSVLRTPGAASGATQIPGGIQVGHGTRVAEIAHLFKQGSLQETGRELDLAIEGDGFFEVALPDGSLAYTRDGSFRRTAAGEVVTVDGYKVSGFDTIDAGTTEITIAPDGSFTSMVNGSQVTKTPITLTRFANPEGLQSIGRNLYRITEASGPAQSGVNPGEEGIGTLAHRYVENSSVSAAEELVNMILSQRSYEANSKAIRASDEMMQEANSLKR
jgi:flagellar basal-body rod protein FlgG